MTDQTNDPIAVIGMSCRFPGGANDPQSFWDLMKNGIDAIREAPKDRWDLGKYTEKQPDVPLRWGGFLKDVGWFDADFFHISPREAESMDPQQRLILEVAWEAIEDAGITRESLKGCQAGVFIGISSNDYAKRTDLVNDPWSGTGNSFSAAAGRLSYFLGLQGPSVGVDTASSSSLVAVHLACQSVRLGECDMALAGGVNLILSPEHTLHMSRLGVMAADGRCKTFDAGADGYVRSDGCGIVLLKRLSAAQRDGDKILAVIRASVANQNGTSSSLTAAHGPSQEALVRRALILAGLSTAAIDYVECHGTGTPLGDRVELQALGNVFSEGRTTEQPVLVGSVKTQIGHAEAAAGVAGLIKVILALQHESLPPHLHFHRPNPKIPWNRIPVEVCSEYRPWPAESGPHLAGVSSFGITGTNAHVIVEQAPAATLPVKSCDRPLLLPLSANSEKALQAMARNWLTALEKMTALPDAVYTASVRRSHLSHRLAVTGKNAAELAAALTAYTQGLPHSGLSAGNTAPDNAPRIVFVFSGQGAHWEGMGRELLACEPVFRDCLSDCDRAVRHEAGWSILEELAKDQANARLNRQDIVQPLLFSLEIALATLWQSWGIEPDMVLGHSLGEIAAARIAGALSLDDATRIICRRSRLMESAAGLGGMAVVELNLAETERLLEQYAGRLCVAAGNSPRATVVSGDLDALDALLVHLEKEKIFGRRIRANIAAHSRHMHVFADALQDDLTGLHPRSERVPIISTVTAQAADGERLTADYWVRNLLEPVRFADALQNASASGPAIFLEISPHPVLSADIDSTLAELNKDFAVLPSLRRHQPERAALFQTMLQLYVKGAQINWSGLYPTGNVVPLPAYPWQRERFWINAAPDVENKKYPASGKRTNRDPLLQAGNGNFETGQNDHPKDDWFFHLQWQQLPPLDKLPTPTLVPGLWLLISDDVETAETLAEALEAKGEKVLHIGPKPRSIKNGGCRTLEMHSPQGFIDLFQEISAGSTPCRGIVRLKTRTTPIDDAIFRQQTEEEIETILNLTQALGSVSWRNLPNLRLVTRGVQSVGNREAIALDQAFLWGLGHTLIMEHPEIRCACIDLCPMPMEGEAAALLAELECPDPEDGVALRPEGRFGARLVPGLPAASDRPEKPDILSDATYLITADGQDSQALTIAHWLLAAGARHLVLLTDENLSSSSWQMSMAELKTDGADVVSMEANLADAAALAACLDRIKAELPPLRGIIQSGSLLETGRLAELGSDRTAVAVRIAKSWNLHRLSLGLPLDFLVFSAAAGSLLGQPGYGMNALADTFLAALTHLRRAEGLPAQTVYWTDSSLRPKDDPSVLPGRHRGLEGPSAVEGGALFPQLLRTRAAQVAMMRLDMRQWVEYYPQAIGSSLVAHLPIEQTASLSPRETALRRTLMTMAAEDRRRRLETFVRDQASQVLNQDPARIHNRTPFSDLGIDSLMGIELRNLLERGLGLHLSATLLWTYPNLSALSEHLLRVCEDQDAAEDDAMEPRTEKDAKQARRQPQIPSDMTEMKEKEPIAVIGLGCRFPGGVHDPETFWQLLMEETDPITEIPAERRIRAKSGEPGARWAGLLNTDLIECFDNTFFGIAPREAASLDPQQRMLLEVAWEAFENAGVPPNQLAGSRTGVFVGIWSQDYAHLINSLDPDLHDAYSLTGNIASVAAGRLAFVLGLQGPCLTVDTACSSSLVALHLATASLRNGECDLALAGGANCILSQSVMDGLSRTRALSPDGRCRTFDSRANGYVRAEGCGMILLKRLSAAQEAGDRIWAVIRGSAVNHDGHSSGLTVPNVLSQQEVLSKALADSDVSAETIGCIEAHGTGTSLGDPIEFEALKAVYGSGTNQCFLGSVKTNIGHAESAAGVAGIIKVILAMRHLTIPRLLHFHSLNPRISLAETRFAIAEKQQTWEADGQPRRAGVSSFGISGTNAHVIVEEAPAVAVRAKIRTRPWLLPISAHTPQALKELAAGWCRFLSSSPPLFDALYTASVRRAHHEHRLTAVGRNTTELAAALEAFVNQEAYPGLAQGSSSRPPRLIFIFPGQGCQWLGMGRQLIETEPVFKAALESCDEAIRRETGWSILQELHADAASSRFDRVEIIQPVLFSIGVALAALWRSWGVEPDMVIGHSMGEVAAAYVAGALNLEDAVRVICRRSRLMSRVSGAGGMAVIELTAQEATEWLTGWESKLSVAAHNSPRSTVVSGDTQALDSLLCRLDQAEIFCRRVKVDVAGHSPQMESLKAKLQAALVDIKPRTGKVPMLSTVTGKILDGPELAPTYWAGNLRNPVRFADAVGQLAASGSAIYLEVSPHPVLSVAVQSMLRRRDGTSNGLAVSTLRRDEHEQTIMLESFGILYNQGVPVSWQHLYPAGDVVSLPGYPWQRERFWLDPQAADAEEKGHFIDDESLHPLLGRALTIAGQPGTRLWENLFDLSHLSYVSDHRVENAVLLPGAAFLDMAVCAAYEVFGEGPLTLEEVQFQEALTFETGPRSVQLVWTDNGVDLASFQIFSRTDTDPWTLHVSGNVRKKSSLPEPEDVRIAALSQQEIAMASEAFYPWFQARGQNYGPQFQGVRLFRQGGDEAIAEIELTADAAGQAGRYFMHPALLDGCLQVLLAAVHYADRTQGPTVPVYLKSMRIFQRPENKIHTATRLYDHGLEGDLFLLDDVGRLLVEIRGLRFQPLGLRLARQPKDDWLLKMDWEATTPPAEVSAAPSGPGCWLLLADSDGLGKTLTTALENLGEKVVSVIPSGQPQTAGCHIVDPASPLAFDDLLLEIAESSLPFRGIVHLWSLSTPSASDLSALEQSLDIGCGSTIHLMQALERKTRQGLPRLWLVTRGAQAVGRFPSTINVTQSPLLGLARTISLEYPKLRCTRIDLNPTPLPDEGQILLSELLGRSEQEELAYRSEGRYTARLVHHTPGDFRHEIHAPAGSRPFRLEVDSTRGIPRVDFRCLDDSQPGPDEVKIAVRAWGLDPWTLHDVFSTHSRSRNTVEPIPLGRECCGFIVAVGCDVQGLDEGMQVLALAPGEVRSVVVVPASLVVSAPLQFAPQEAASLLWPHVTACYALAQLARLSPQDRLLIHGASQDVGQAAIQWAQKVGAAIYVTDETLEKRELLTAQGIPSVGEWDRDRYVDDIDLWTNGKGVDVVLNCLPYRLTGKGLTVLKSHGRVIQLSENEMQLRGRFNIAPPTPNLSFSFLDVKSLIQEGPEHLQEVLHEVVSWIEQGALTPLATRVLSVRDFSHALALSEDEALGDTTVLVLDDPQLPIAMPLPAGDALKADGTYLITGGLGGLGIELAMQLTEKGARHLALLSRSGCKTDQQAAAVAKLTDAGARVLVLKTDVADPEMMQEALVRIRAEMPPLRGIVHAAGLLDDALIPRQNLERLHTVASPKISGAWNLHVLSEKDPLDFFILYSSVATIVGLPGLGNYAAANAFLDALAHLRHSQGRPALSINWGNFAKVGLAAASSIRGERLVHQGLDTINPEEGTKILLELLARERSAQVCVTPLDVQKWVQAHPHVASSSLLAQLIEDKAGEMTTGSTRFTDILRTALPQERQGLMENFVRDEVAKVLRMQPSQIGPNIRFKSLGIDSLMGLEIRNRIETTLDLRLPATLLWTHPDVSDLASYLNHKIQPQDDNGSGFGSALAGEQVHMRLFCFPYGGGDASIFNHWTNQLPPEIEVFPIQLPGRFSASGLGDPKDFSELVKAVEHLISPLLDVPYAFYGHSMGALLAFEVARSLRRNDFAAPLHLFLSAYPPPNAHMIQSLLPIKENMTDEDLLKVSALLIPTIGKLENKEYVSPILPLLRSDFTLVNSYHYLAESPLSCPITAFGGLEDEVVKKEHLLAWQNQTLGAFSLKMIPGDHLFLHPSWETIVTAIEEDLATN